MVFSTAFAGFLLLVDPLGGAPIFQSLTKECTVPAQVALAVRATMIASSILLVFIFLGRSVFDYFGILPDVFKVAGGLLLFSSSAQLIGNHSHTANKIIRTESMMIRTEDGMRSPQPIPASPMPNSLPHHQATEADKHLAGAPVERSACGKHCRWFFSLPAVLRSPQVQLEVREKTPTIIFPMVMPLMAGPGSIAFAVLITELAREGAKDTPGGEWLALLEVILALGAVMVACLLTFTTSRLFISRLGETFSRVATSVVGILVASMGVQYIYDGLLSLIIGALNDPRLQAALAAVQLHLAAADANVTLAT